MNRNRAIRNVAILALFAAVYFAAGKLGLQLAFVNASVTAVWPPTGIALGGLLVLGLRVWPFVFLGAFLVNITTTGSIPTFTFMLSTVLPCERSGHFASLNPTNAPATLSILLVDDHEDTRRALDRLLSAISAFPIGAVSI